MRKIIITLLATTVVVSACSTSSATFRSGIRFEGDNARKDRYGLYQLDIKKSLGISLVGNCAEVVQTGTMTFPFIPMPPVLPTGNKAKKDAAQRPFTLILQSSHGLRVNHARVAIKIALEGKEQLLKFSDPATEGARGSKQFTYPTPYTCSQITTATISIENLVVAGTSININNHAMNFFEETKWSNN